MRARVMAVAVACFAVLIAAGIATRARQEGTGDRARRIARAVEPSGKVRTMPELIVLVDPQCPACRQAVEELEELVRPRELGLQVRVLRRDDPAQRPAFEALGFGLVPGYVVVGRDGSAGRVLRGYRPAPLLRAWLEKELAAAMSRAGPDA